MGFSWVTTEVPWGPKNHVLKHGACLHMASDHLLSHAILTQRSSLTSIETRPSRIFISVYRKKRCSLCVSLSVSFLFLFTAYAIRNDLQEINIKEEEIINESCRIGEKWK